jgi:UDP-N-acetylmuramate--alanine ligase
VSFGIEKKAEYMAKTDTYEGKRSVSILHNGKKIGEFYPHEYGRHNVYNALCAFAVAHKNKIAPEVICSALSSYQGIFRRQEYVKDILVGCESKSPTHCGEGDEKSAKNGHICPLFLDYAHHPTEISASLNALKDMGYKRVLCVFQPHTYSRTQNLMEDFIEVLKHSEPIIIFKTYPAREKYVAKGSALTLYKNLKKMGVKECFYAKNNKELSALIDQNDKGKSGVLALGAGDIYDRFLKIIKRRQKNLKIL